MVTIKSKAIPYKPRSNYYNSSGSVYSSTGGGSSSFSLTKDLIMGLLVDADGVFRLNANLAVEGGVTMRYADPMRLPTIMDSLILDDATLAVVDGKLTVVGGTGGGLDETELANYLTEHNYYHAGNANLDTVDWTAKNLIGESVISHGYVYAENGWFQVNQLGTGLYNRATDARWYSNTNGWNSDKPIIINNGYDTKLIFNNTDGEKYTSITFQENGAQYAYINVDGRTNGTFTFSGLPVKVDSLYFSSGISYIANEGSQYIGMATNGGNARGQFYHSGTYAGTRLGGIGCYTLNGDLEQLYMGWGSSPWMPATNFHVNSTEIQYKGNTLWHAGNMGAGSGLNADMLDGYHRHALFTGGIWDFLDNGTNGTCARSIVVNGDKDTYYPVVIAVSSNYSWIDNIITVSKTLGSQTPNWSGNHENGTSSGIFRFHYRTGIWDGDGSLLNTVNRTMPYANWVGHLEFAYSSVGKAVVWLRGGGAQYDIHCNNALSEASIYYTRTNIYANDTYPAWVEPKTSGNYGYFANGTATPCFSTVYFSNNEYYINDASFKIGLFEATSQDFKIRSKRALVGTTDRLYINYGNDWTNVQINGIIDFNRAIFPNDRVSIGANDFWDTPKLSIATHLYPIAFYNPNGTSNKRRYYFSLGADNLSINSLNDGNSWVRNLVTFYHDGQTEIHGNNIIKGKTFAHAQTAYGSTPAISLAIGDSDTGFNWKSDGVIGIWSNNGERGYWDSSTFYWSGNLLVRGGITMHYTSDRRLKENLRRFDAHSLIAKLGGVYEYDYTDKAIQLNSGLPRHSIGLIAQKVERYFPFMVSEDDNGYKGINYIDAQFISLLAASEIQTISKLKVLEKRQSKEEKEIKKLKARISELERLVAPKKRQTNIL